MLRARQAARCVSPMRPMSSPATRTVPAVGWSIPAMRFRSVVFPEPEGPISASNEPSGMSRSMPSSTTSSCLSRT